MTSVIRYVTNISTAANTNIKVDSTGKDYQLIAFTIKTVAAIAADADANILTWTGSGTIKQILSVFVRNPTDGAVIPMGLMDGDTHTLVTLDATRKTINISIPAGGVAIPANSLISLLLVIGNY